LKKIQERKKTAGKKKWGRKKTTRPVGGPARELQHLIRVFKRRWWHKTKKPDKSGKETAEYNARNLGNHHKLNAEARRSWPNINVQPLTSGIFSQGVILLANSETRKGGGTEKRSKQKIID